MPAAIKIHLSSFERRSLIQQLQKKSGRAVKRVMAILLLDAGEPTSRILEILCISRTTLYRWKNRWLRQRSGGLEDQPRCGPPIRADARYIREMIFAVQQDPRAFGYAFSRWTAPRLAAYLHEKTGVQVTPEWLRQLLYMHGFLWRRSKRTLRNLQDPVAIKQSQRALQRLKRGPQTPTRTMSSGSATASALISYP
jgi:transposase